MTKGILSTSQGSTLPKSSQGFALPTDEKLCCLKKWKQGNKRKGNFKNKSYIANCYKGKKLF